MLHQTTKANKLIDEEKNIRELEEYAKDDLKMTK